MPAKKKKNTKKPKKSAVKTRKKPIKKTSKKKAIKKVVKKVVKKAVKVKSEINEEILIDDKLDDQLKAVFPKDLDPQSLDIRKEVSKKNLIIGRQFTKKSPHVVNLKNPNQDLFENNLPTQKTPKLTLKPAPIAPIRPPRTIPSRGKKVGVNFITSKNLFNKLGLISLFRLISLPFKFLFTKTSSTYLKPKDTPAKEDYKDLLGEDVEDIFGAPNSFSFFKLNIPRDWHKKVAVFVVIAVVLIIPLQAFTYYQTLQSTKDKILLMTNEAIEKLKDGQYSIISLDLDQANLEFDQARANFSLAQREIDKLSALTSEILKLLPGQNNTVSAAITLLEVGEIVAETGQILINSGQLFLAGDSINDYYLSLVSFEANLKTAIENFNQAKTKIENIKPTDLPADHQETFAKVLTYLPIIKKGLTDLYAVNNSLLKILGHKQWQRYMLVFLNNNELRGGGGFMGSFGIIDIDRGEIKNLEIPGGGTYDIQGQLIPKVIAPEPLWLINSRWEFQDSNWWPDFPTTAKKIQWFYQNADGPSVDGVITLTSTLMERLLDIFGPISMPEYGREITSENFVIETQKIVEIEYDREENRPKQFIADLAPKLMERIFDANSSEVEQLFNLIKNGLNEKHLLVYFNDAQIKDVISDFGWSGEIKQTDGDYLSVVHTNLAGGKTDGVIKEIIDHQAEVQADGSIINTVKLTRQHTGVAGENIFTGVQNNSYVRFYVPLGSALLEASGFEKPPDKLFEKPLPDYQTDLDLISIESDKIKDEQTGMDIYKESGKTVFGNWLQLKPGQVGEATIKYRLPFNLSLEGQNTFYYSLLVQKQHGSLGSQLRSYLKLNNQLKPLAKFPANITSDDSGVNFTSKLITDQFYGAVLISK